MKQILNGFQCEKCKSIYANEDQAESCEQLSIQKPSLKIGDVLIDDSYDVEIKIRVSEIYFEGHNVKYRMEGLFPDGKGWSDLYSIYEDDVKDYEKNID